MLISITELHIKNLWKFPLFMWHASRSAKQSQNAEGNIKTLLNGGWLRGYTITAWEDIDSMMQFRNAGDHKEAMHNMRQVASAYRSMHWETDVIPTWKEAKIKLGEIELKKV
jgi:heme-degrading monooxygenase HmoA